MEIAFAALALTLLALTIAARFGFPDARARRRALEQLAAARGWLMSDDGTGFTATVNGVAIDVRFAVVPTHSGPMGAWRAHTRLDQTPGTLTLRPKHEDAPAGMRIGDVDFDTCFELHASSRDLATKLLHPDARRALFAFGPRGQCTYTDGDLTLQWESAPTADPLTLDRAITVLAALSRPAPTPYRDIS